MQTDDQNEDGKTQTSHIGRYQVLGEVGRGGMAVVYRAYDPRFRREVAVKVLPRQFTHDHTFRSRFEREAQTIATLEHPAIVPVYDFGEEDEQPYLVMRYMSGGSLADRLQTGRLNLQQAAEMMATIAGALEYAHARGVVHRDLKPGNILFDDQHNPYLADFGIAKLAEATTSITGSSIIGTPAYMSPEQAKGGQPVDGRTDIYALGVILYEMLTGKAPYEADTPVQVLMKHIMDPVPEVNTNQYNLPPAINKILHYALAKEVDIRYQTPHHLMSDLLALTRGLPPTLPAAQRTKAISPPRSPMLRWPWFAAGLLLLLALVSGGLWLGGV
ncbi:protein kinase, partial [Arthrospira platensis SPKY1]|nr:protein kinase [Arthrospira platensis SPKY1]